MSEQNGNWEASSVLFDEDALENFLYLIRKKVETLWENGYQIDAEVKLDYELLEESQG